MMTISFFLGLIAGELPYAAVLAMRLLSHAQVFRTICRHGQIVCSMIKSSVLRMIRLVVYQSWQPHAS